jgi:glucan phosphorylase
VRRSNSACRYKRQLLNALAIIKRYGDLKRASPEERAQFVRKTVFFAGKAAPGYFNAKCIIRLICGICDVVNADPDTNHYLKVFFVPNYNVTLAEKMIPASDLSQVAPCCTSHVTHHTSHVTHHASHVTVMRSTFLPLVWRPVVHPT